MLGRRSFYSIFALTTALCFVPSVSLAKDELENIVRKDKLSSADLATIQTEVKARAAKLMAAAKNPKQLREARNSLIATAKVKNASQAGLEAYASTTAAELVASVTSDILTLGLESVQTLVELDHPSCAESLAAALGSGHTAVRYRAAVGIRSLHARIKDNRGACRAVLAALGNAGANEENDLVLRAIYEAIDFKAGVPAFQGADEAAGALVEVFSGRLDQLARGSRDEWKDVPGYECAANCFADATQPRKVDVAKALVGFLSEAVRRYEEPDVAADYIPTLLANTKTLEDSLQKLLKSGNIDAPVNPVSGKMAAARSDASRKAVKEGLAAWIEAFKKSPWPIQ